MRRRHDDRASGALARRASTAALAVFLLVGWGGSAAAQETDDVRGPDDSPAESSPSEASTDESDDSSTPRESESDSAEVEEGDTTSEDGETTSEAESEQGAADDENSEETAGVEDAPKSDDEKQGELIDREESVEREMVGRKDADDRDRALVDAGVNFEGVPGFRNITSASTDYPRTFNVAFNSEITGGQNIVRQNDTNQYLAGRLTLHAQIIEYFSANISLGARNNVNTFGRPQSMLSQGDAFLGLRGHYSPTEFLHLGSDLSFDFPTGFGAAGVDFSGTSVRPRLLGTLDLNPLISGTDLPLRTHLNIGYRADNTANTVPSNVELTRVERFAHDISAFDRLELALGAEYDFPYVSPFVAWRLDIPVNPVDGTCGALQPLDCPASAGFASFPDRISLGARAEPIEQLGLHAGIDLGLTAQDAQGVPVTPPFKVFFGASWKIDPRPKIERVTKTIVESREAPRGHVAGTLIDQKTGEPVGGATVSYPNLERSAQMSGKENGKFRSYGIEPGSEVVLQIDHPKYHAEKVTQKVEKMGEIPTEIELEPKPQKGQISGRVTDRQGEPLTDAVVRFDGPETLEVRVDSSGEFAAEVKDGSYQAGAIAPNREAERQELEVEAGGEHDLSFELAEGPGAELVSLEDDMVDLDAEIAFESGSADMTDESRERLDQLAAFLRAHPELDQVEVQGHTDDVGSKENNMELSQRRAETVRDYLVQQGIASDRLAAEGYGPTQPLVPNISETNRRKNRRVDFKVVER